MITIDGSQGEGGGQVLRTATALSAILKAPCKIFNIRANRPNPGLREQHLQGILAVAKLCSGSVNNAFVGSKEIEFLPGDFLEKEIDVNISTAGSVTLVLQSLALAALPSREEIKIKIKGGATNTSWSPPADYTINVFFPLLEKMGYEAGMEIIRRGFYPKGGAEVVCTVKPPKRLENIKLDSRGEVKIIKGVSVCSNLPESVAERQRTSAESILEKAGYETEITEEVVSSYSAGSALVLWAGCENSILGADALGEIKKSAESVGGEAAKKMVAQLENGFSIDIHAMDQIVPYMALAEGESFVTTKEITGHTSTNINICEKLVGVKFRVDKNKISVVGRDAGAHRNV
ncbi:MAG: RNA 3'-terminal phosphate cyclase [Candidatus Aenigmarchaeota archaeon]|nr:RNA 3'-terminal phosphate cyclase [Candidatus Aenigmarchaeota archaeon]